MRKDVEDVTATRMYVYMNKQLMVVETAIEWALKYWKARKRVHPGINWKIIGEKK